MADVQRVIRERLAEIDSEKRRLEAALGELTAGKVGGVRRRESSSTSGRTGRTRRAKRGERPRQVLAHLERNPGARPSEIASAIKASPNQVHLLIAKLRRDKLVRKRGKGYGLALRAESSSVKAPSSQASDGKAPTARRRGAVSEGGRTPALTGPARLVNAGFSTAESQPRDPPSAFRNLRRWSMNRDDLPFGSLLCEDHAAHGDVGGRNSRQADRSSAQ